MNYNPLHKQKLIILPINKILPKTTYYLIQQHNNHQTPLTTSLITQFQQKYNYLQN